MDAHQWRFGAGGNVAHAKHNALLHFAAVLAVETIDPEMAESAGEISFRYFGEHRGDGIAFIIMIGRRDNGTDAIGGAAIEAGRSRVSRQRPIAV